MAHVHSKFKIFCAKKYDKRKMVIGIRAKLSSMIDPCQFQNVKLSPKYHLTNKFILKSNMCSHCVHDNVFISWKLLFSNTAVISQVNESYHEKIKTCLNLKVVIRIK